MWNVQTMDDHNSIFSLKLSPLLIMPLLVSDKSHLFYYMFIMYKPAIEIPS